MYFDAGGDFDAGTGDGRAGDGCSGHCRTRDSGPHGGADSRPHRATGPDAGSDADPGSDRRGAT